jgi:hypothetical protein
MQGHHDDAAIWRYADAEHENLLQSPQSVPLPCS